MKYAKFFSVFVFITVAIYGALGFYSLPLASFQGDLTRVSTLPESMFGWTQPQPVIDSALMLQSSWQEADVLVVGDSFSDARIWQSVLTRTGMRVHTESWDSVRGICEDFMPWLRERGFNGKYIVFESVERNVADGIEKSVACRHMQFHHSMSADSPRSSPPGVIDRSTPDYSGKISIGLQTQLNLSKYLKISAAADFKSWDTGRGGIVARVNQGCDLFSHAQCKDAIFLAADRSDDLPLNTLDNIEKLNARLSGVTPIWVFVPNKSTTYLHPNKQFWNVAEQRLHAPNILKSFQEALTAKTVDLYPANNTHVSTAGYLVLGNAIYQSIQQLQR